MALLTFGFYSDLQLFVALETLPFPKQVAWMQTNKFHTSQFSRHRDEVAEWLRRWTANPMCSARVGSNPILVGTSFISFLNSFFIIIINSFYAYYL